MSTKDQFMYVDVQQVDSYLWVGASPPVDLKGMFDFVVLCAEEDQRPRNIPTMQVPFSDIEWMDDQTLDMIRDATFEINMRRRNKQKVLVSCIAGVNRSAFVAAMALRRAGSSAEDALARIRSHRFPAVGMRPLSNREFVRQLQYAEAT